MMRQLLVLALSLVLVGLGCSDDDSTGDASVNDATSNSDFQIPDSGPPKLSGKVVQFTADDAIPVEGAKVSILDASPAVETTTSADGSFELDPPESPGVIFLLVEKTGLIGGLRGVIAVSGGLSGIELGLLPPAMADSILDELTLPDRDPAKGIVTVEFGYDSETAVGGEKAEIGAENDGSFVFDADGDPQSGDTLVEDGQTSVIYANAATGTTTVTITADGCSPVLGAAQTYPVRADTMTTVDFICL